MSTFEIFELILLGTLVILMAIMIAQECNRQYWKSSFDIPDKQEKYLFMLESGIIILGYATKVISSYYPNGYQWVFDQDKSGIHFEDTCGYRIIKWKKLN